LRSDVDPNWNAHFEFGVNDIEELHQELRFHVYDYDKYSEDDRIGSAGLSPENVWGLQKVMGDAKFAARVSDLNAAKAAADKDNKRRLVKAKALSSLVSGAVSPGTKRRQRRQSLSGDPRGDPELATHSPTNKMQFGISRPKAQAVQAIPGIEGEPMWSPSPSRDWIMCFNDQQHPYYQVLKFSVSILATHSDPRGDPELATQPRNHTQYWSHTRQTTR
jgi:hypothetical protein